MKDEIIKIMDHKKSQMKETQKEINNLRRNIVNGKYDRLDRTDGWTQLDCKLDEMTHLTKRLCKYELQFKKLKDCYFDA